MAKKLIIGVSGKKQSGKNTLCDCLYNFFSEKYSKKDIIILSFVDTLKQKVCKDVLGLTEEQVNGTDEQKNSLTIYEWGKMSHQIRYNNKLEGKCVCEYVLPTGFMTAREILQIVGTDIFRNYFDDDVWINATLKAIEKNDAQVVLISDVRFPGEVISLINNEGYVIRLLRDVCDIDTHSSETALDDFDFKKEKCIIFDNTGMDIKQQNEATVKMIKKILNEK